MGLWVLIPEKPMVVATRASDLNSLVSSNKVFLLTERKPHKRRARTGNKSVEYKLHDPPQIFVSIAYRTARFQSCYL